MLDISYIFPLLTLIFHKNLGWVVVQDCSYLGIGASHPSPCPISTFHNLNFILLQFPFQSASSSLSSISPPGPLGNVLDEMDILLILYPTGDTLSFSWETSTFHLSSFRLLVFSLFSVPFLCISTTDLPPTKDSMPYTWFSAIPPQLQT